MKRFMLVMSVRAIGSSDPFTNIQTIVSANDGEEAMANAIQQVADQGRETQAPPSIVWMGE